MLVRIDDFLDLDDLKFSIKRLYEEYENYLREGKDIKFERPISNIGTVTNYWTTGRALFKEIFDDETINNDEVFEMLDDWIDGESYMDDLKGNIKLGENLWFTWNYDDAENPFSFLISEKLEDRKKELVDKLALNEKYYLNTRLCLFTFSKKSYNIFRPTICDAGDFPFFRIAKSTHHGFTFPLLEHKENGDNLSKPHKNGRPEGVIECKLVDIKDTLEIGRL